MADHVGDSLEEVHTLIKTIFLFPENLSLDHNHAQYSSAPQSTTPNTSRPQNALITRAPSLELRQNNPQDCQNLIDASVDRATVEISRTIIRLNATFSQQLQEASISASNGIKSAQDSASSSIGVVVKSAEIANSSAVSSITFANRQVTNANLALTSAQSSANDALSSANISLEAGSSSLSLANLALTSVSLASSSDVARLSSSFNLLQASASAAIAAAQVALASATGSAAAQASSILASAASQIKTIPPGVTQTTIAGNQPNPGLQSPSAFSLTPGQIAGIAVGAVAISVLLSLVVYFTIMRMKKQHRDSYLDEEDISRSPKEVPSRMSSTFRTGNGITLKFNPPKSSEAPPPNRPALRQPGNLPGESSSMRQIKPGPILVPEFKGSNGGASTSVSPAWPLTATTSKRAFRSLSRSRSPNTTTWPLKSAGLNQSVATPPVPLSFEPPAVLLDLAPKTDEVSKVRAGAAPSPIEDLGFMVLHPKTLSIDLFSDLNGETNQGQVLEDIAVQQSGLVTDQEDMGIQEPGVVPVDTEDVMNPFDDIFSPLEEGDNLPDPFENGTVADMNEPVADEDETVVEPIEDIPIGNAEESGLEYLGQKAAYINDLPTGSQPAESALEQAPQLPKLIARESVHEPEHSRASTFPEIDNLIRIVANENGVVGKKPLFWTDFRSPDPEVQRAMSPPPLRKKGSRGGVSPLRKLLRPRQKTLSSEPLKTIERNTGKTQPRDVSPISTSIKALSQPSRVRIKQKELLLSPTRSEQVRDRTLSPLRQNPVTPVVLDQKNMFSLSSGIPAVMSGSLFPSQLLVEERKETPLVQVFNISSPPIENEKNAQPTSEEIGEAADPDDRQTRGRSMIRTSDIIEARLSAIAQLQEDRKSMEILQSRLTAIAQKEEEMSPLQALEDDVDRTKSPLRRNPVDLAQIPASSRNNTLSPLRQNSSTSTVIKRRSRTLSPAPPPNPLPTPVPSPIFREDSLLSRNPLNATPSINNPNNTFMDPAMGNRVRMTSNTLFEQSLSKFQTLANQNPQDGIIASNEVTSRAIAGIYIPGSLREQAVRNLSKSRERRKDREE